jgi:hypothetical protein
MTLQESEVIMRTYDLNRGLATLIGAGIAGGLIWLSSAYIDDSSTGGYWAVYGIIAGAGLVLALSQLVGGWTKWGAPRVSLGTFLLGFLPVLIVVGWVACAMQPHGNTVHDHVLTWSGNVGIADVVKNLGEYIAVLSFGLGAVFGFTFDTLGVGRGEEVVTTTRGRAPLATTPAGYDRRAADEPLTAERTAVPQRTREDELVGVHRGDGSPRNVEIREGGNPVAPQPDPTRTPETMD